MNPTVSQPARKTASRYGGKLLIVDDNLLNRTRLAQRLTDNGYTVTTIEDGFKALELIDQQDFDLILLDTMMPGMPGEEVLRELKDDSATRDIPVIMISGLDEAESVATCIELGAADILSSPFDPVLLRARIDSCLETRRLREQEAKYLQQLQVEMEHSDRLVNVVIPIGLALMREPDYNRLLEKILIEAKSLCHADGGTLYLRENEKFLKFVLLRNDSLKIKLGGSTGNPITFPPLNLFDPVTGKPNHHQVACHVALTGSSVNIADAYDVEGFDFRGTREFDQKTGYRSQSFLTLPLLNEQNEVIGVLQLINAQDAETGKVIPFDPILQQSVESLSLLAAAAVENYQRLQGAAATKS
jgi:CheY-like chemotaxis protein